jgi:hypothetical protein
MSEEIQIITENSEPQSDFEFLESMGFSPRHVKESLKLNSNIDDATNWLLANSDTKLDKTTSFIFTENNQEEEEEKIEESILLQDSTNKNLSPVFPPKKKREKTKNHRIGCPRIQ